MIRALLALLFLALPAQAEQVSMPPFPEAVLDEFQAVGRVNISGFKTKGNCTGTLVRPDVVLTAGHCTATTFASKRVFVAGWRRGEFVAASGMKREERHPAYGLGGTHNPRFDVGLLFLENPITEVAPIPVSRVTQDVVAVAGYHWIIPHLLSGRLDCPVQARSRGLLGIGCPVVGGNSGGPVLQKDENGAWVVSAVVSSQAKAGAVAVELPEWVFEMLGVE
jgi:hypothetical protein